MSVKYFLIKRVKMISSASNNFLIRNRHSKKIAEALITMKEDDCKGILNSIGLTKVKTLGKYLVCSYCETFHDYNEKGECNSCGAPKKSVHVWTDTSETHNMQSHFYFEEIYAVSEFIKNSGGIYLA